MKGTLVAASLLVALAAGTATAGGLHSKPWFSVTFKDVAEDIEMAAEEGKRLAIIVEQENCLYCAKMHEEVLSDPEVADYIKEHFWVVQYDMWGAEEVTDLDGEVMTEKRAARRWGLSFTPTVMFLPEEPGGAETAKEAAVEIMPGAFGKWTVLHMFRWVAEKRYEGDQPFQKWHAEEIQKLRDEGRL
jgi:thioredoxin-related protein